MRIAIVGAGGVGGYFGARLAASGADVSFLARGAHLAAMREKGLFVTSPAGDFHVPRVMATDDAKAIGAVDVVMLAVKMYDLEAIAALLPSLLGPDGVVIPFQNGVEATDLIAKAVGRPHTGAGTAYVSAAIASPGIIRHAGLGKLIFGELDGARSRRLEELLAATQKASIEAVLSEHVEVDVWTKFVRLSALSAVAAWARCTAGAIREDPDLFDTWKSAVREGIAVARARGIGLPQTAFEDALEGFQAIPAPAKASMLEDLEHGRPLELPWLSGAVVRIGREVGVDVPVHRGLAKALRPYMRGTQRA